MIDNILVSNRQGRSLEGYDEVLSDPNIKNALELGNDTIARTYIKSKLCSLQLINVSIILYANSQSIDFSINKSIISSF